MTEQMERNLNLALATPLFSGFNRQSAAELIRALGGEAAQYAAGTVIAPLGSPAPEPPCILLVLAGQIQHIHYGLRDRQSIIDYTMPGGVFGWAQAYGGENVFRNAAVAGTDCTLLRLYVPDVGKADRNWTLFERNLMKVVAAKSVRLERKVDILSQRSVREKLLVYLQHESAIQDRRDFHIPLGRQALADYLCIDRTTLSTELSKMRAEGLLSFDKNYFTLLPRGDTEDGR